MTYEAGVNIS
jgi:WD40 repeat protein